jgi:RNA polymerase sigma-54 factor
MKLSLDLRATLSQTLTPQQIQYLKLLQLPVVQLEQFVLQEIEQNPMLEELNEQEVIFERQSDFDATESFELEPVEAYSETVENEYDGLDYEHEKSQISDEF